MPVIGVKHLTCILIIALVAGPAAASCPVAYSGAGTNPLLYGGAEEECLWGCQPRDGSIWNKVCKRDPVNPSWGLCLPQQRAQLLGFLQQQVQQGAADASILNLHPCQLFDILASGGRTLWLIGDSHIKQMYAAIRCFMTDFWVHADGECAASSSQGLQDQLDDVTAAGHQYRTPPRCLHLIGDSGARICLVHSPKGDMMFSPANPKGIGTLELLQRSFVAPQDIIYVSVGRWHANSCEGVSANLPSILTNIGRFARDNAASLPNFFFSLSPFDHLQCAPNRTLVMPPHADTCVPYSQGGYSMDVWRRAVQTAQDILGDTYAIPLIDTYKWTVQLNFGHIFLGKNGWDCLHYCRPGLPEIEIWHMFKAIQTRGLRAAGSSAGSDWTVQQAGRSRVCRGVGMQFNGAGDPLVAADRDDLGYLIPPEPQVV